MIQIEQLTKYYGERKAVGPLSFEIEQGEVVGLLGLNGAGKTTTLRMLSSDLLPTSGQMRIDGVDMVEAPEKVRPKIGYLPDRPPLYGEMTVREYLTFAAKLKKTKGHLRRRVDEVIEATDAGEYADARIDTLSHGYRQRVGIAQAIVHQPKLLLLDEPISGLDPVQIVEMRALIRSLRGEHTTVVSSHILSEISETCDRLLVIRDGEIVASGTEDELRAKMTGGTQFSLTVRPPEGKDGLHLQGIVDAVEGVTRVDEADALGEGRGALAVEVGSDVDVREAVVAAVVEAGYGLLALERGGRELESVFLELTGRPQRRRAEREEGRR